MKAHQKFKAKIAYLRTVCDTLHKRAKPYLKKRVLKFAEFPLTQHKMTLNDCKHSHKVIKRMRFELKYKLTKEKLVNKLNRITKRCTFIKTSLENKKCSNKKCKRNVEKKKFITLKEYVVEK